MNQIILECWVSAANRLVVQVMSGETTIDNLKSDQTNPAIIQAIVWMIENDQQDISVEEMSNWFDATHNQTQSPDNTLHSPPIW